MQTPIYPPHPRKSGRLYAWVSPAFMPPGTWSPVEHTWVTSYHSLRTPCQDINAVKSTGENYWYCFGGFHPGSSRRHIAYCSSTLGLEHCLVGANDPKSSGTIVDYGIDGVCHQVANQVLYANSAQHTWKTVQRAKGYPISSAIYGTYGRHEEAWMAQRLTCAVSAASYRPSISTLTSRAARVLKVSHRHTVVHVLESVRQNLLKQIDAIGYRPRQLHESVEMRVEEINAQINNFLKEAAHVLAQELNKQEADVVFQKIFGIAPHERIYLLDPNLFQFPDDTKTERKS